MGVVNRFLATYEGLIYILLVLSGLFAFRWLWKSWCEWRQSIFGLEREFALRRLSQALAVCILILVVFFAEMFLASFVVPGLPSANLLATPTANLLDQQNGAFSGDSPSIALTALPAVLEGEVGSGCVPDRLMLTSPEPGQDITGITALEGTVNISNFGFYKFEVSPRGADTWATISAGTEIVSNGEIGTWDTSNLTPGDYEVRLVVIDNQGNSLPPCMIPVRVIASP